MGVELHVDALGRLIVVGDLRHDVKEPADALADHVIVRDLIGAVGRAIDLVVVHEPARLDRRVVLDDLLQNRLNRHDSPSRKPSSRDAS